AFYVKDKDYISYVGKDKKMNLLTTIGNRDGSKKALMRVCGAIVTNPDLYEILMDYDCLISKDLETNSIYEGAGDYLKDYKIENNHIYHCKNLKIDRKSTRLNSSHVSISYAVFCLKKK